MRANGKLATVLKWFEHVGARLRAFERVAVGLRLLAERVRYNCAYLLAVEVRAAQAWLATRNAKEATAMIGDSGTFHRLAEHFVEKHDELFAEQLFAAADDARPLKRSISDANS